MHRRLLPMLATAASLLAAPLQANGPVDPVAAWQADPTRVFDATEIDLEDFQWIARPVLVFANSPFDPAYEEQMEELVREAPELAARDVVVVVDTDPDAASEPRSNLRPRGFMLVLMGKDGQVKLRKPLPWTVRELSRSIDKMPMRRRELREGG